MVNPLKAICGGDTAILIENPWLSMPSWIISKVVDILPFEFLARTIDRTILELAAMEFENTFFLRPASLFIRLFVG